NRWQSSYLPRRVVPPSRRSVVPGQPAFWWIDLHPVVSHTQRHLIRQVDGFIVHHHETPLGRTGSYGAHSSFESIRTAFPRHGRRGKGRRFGRPATPHPAEADNAATAHPGNRRRDWRRGGRGSATPARCRKRGNKPMRRHYWWWN